MESKKTISQTNQNPPPWQPNPAQKLERGFKRIQTSRMLGMPFLHPKVQVEAVGFKKWKYFWLGIMITPWAINIILTKGDPTRWKSVPSGKKLHYEFPAGLYDFISVHDNILGEYQMCSLISPLVEISDHKMAHEVADAALLELMKPRQEQEDLGTPLKPAEKEIDSDAIEKAIQNSMQKPVARRSFIKPSVLKEDQ